jgi:hypothetical protein
MWKKNKLIHKYKHDQIYIHMQNMFLIVEMFEETKGRRERKRE